MKNQEFPPKNNNNLMKPPVPYKPESVIRHARLSANSSIYSKNKHNNNKNLIQKRITQFEQTATTQVGFLLDNGHIYIQYTNMHVLDYTKKNLCFFINLLSNCYHLPKIAKKSSKCLPVNSKHKLII